MNIAEIRDYKSHLMTMHSNRISEQQKDLTFIKGDFEQPLIKNAKYKVESKFALSMMNDITQKMIGDNPRAFVSPKKDTDTSKNASERIAKELNRQLKSLLRQNNNPFQLSFKRITFSHGESWIYVVHDELLSKWKGYGENAWQNVRPDAIPVHFIQYDPMIVFSDPSEEINGVPKKVVVYYKRPVAEIKKLYPHWSPKDVESTDKVDFLLYCDKDMWYAEADEREIFIRKNIYDCVPFVHGYSGYGLEDESRSPELMTVSRVEMIREKIVEDAQMDSDFRYNIHNFAHRSMNVFVPAGGEIPEDMLAKYRNEPDSVNIIPLPEGADPGFWKPQDSQLFEAPVFAYRDRVKQELNSEHPNSLRGIATGTSGRQEDVLSDAALSFYQTPYLNCVNMWAQALEIGLKVCEQVPSMRPPIIHEGDINQYSEVKVSLEREDPQMQARKRAEGKMLLDGGQISMTKFHTEYCGMTLEESKQEQARIIVESIKRDDPAFRIMVRQKMAQKMGVEQEIAQIEAAMAGEGTGLNPTPKYGSRGGQPRLGNIKTMAGQQMADQSSFHEPRRSNVQS
jgi:hypothetical protein